MIALEELLPTAEVLAEAVDEYRDLARCSAPEREDFDSDEDFLFAVECYEDDRKATAARLGRAFRDYRCAQQRELSARHPQPGAQRLTPTPCPCGSDPPPPRCGATPARNSL